MPKLGMEPLRRQALIDAAIAAIGEHGTLDVTMSDIAGRAGVSPALAHHYFGAKDGLMQATMRAILRQLAAETVAALRLAAGPRERISAIICVNFSAGQFRDEIVAAWLAFYVEAQRKPAMRRLLRVYARRLNSNLMSALTPVASRADAARIAEGVGALIDGLYIRRALAETPSDAASAIALVENYVDTQLAALEGDL
jgi:TetR/AcrR family transcriptional repressor of bet genes